MTAARHAELTFSATLMRLLTRCCRLSFLRRLYDTPIFTLPLIHADVRRYFADARCHCCQILPYAAISALRPRAMSHISCLLLLMLTLSSFLLTLCRHIFVVDDEPLLMIFRHYAYLLLMATPMS